MEENAKTVVWITGASSGIGEACAYEYAQRGASLILTATSIEKLEQVANKCRRLGAKAAVVPFDFSDNSDIEIIAEKGWDIFGKVDTLFCNAGISQRTTTEETSMEMTRKIMEVNFFAPVALTKALLPKMLTAGGGHIAVTTSIAGRFGFPLRCAYSASKHALDGYFETLQAEYAERNIKVTFVCPGRVQTMISVRALDKGGEPHGVMDPGQAGGLSATKAAQKIVRAISKGKREVLVGRKELIMTYIKRFFPGLCAHLAKKIKPL